MTPVEGESAWVGGLKVRGQMAPIDDFEAVLHQLAAEASSLENRVNAKPREIPVRVRGMSRVHLFENSEGVTVPIRQNGLCEHSTDGIAVRLRPEVAMGQQRRTR